MSAYICDYQSQMEKSRTIKQKFQGGNAVHDRQAAKRQRFTLYEKMAKV